MSKAIPASVTRLIDQFARLPGVGPKTASRLTYFLLRAPNEVSETLSKAVLDLKAQTRLCSVCFNITEVDPCEICVDSARDSKLIAVVEEPLDLLALERAGGYMGRYHVLHGALNPREGIFPEHLRMRELIKRVQTDNLEELILATNPGQEGDYTALMIKKEIEDLKLPLKITRLARGLPIGADLEYADSVTLMRALQGRQGF